MEWGIGYGFPVHKFILKKIPREDRYCIPETHIIYYLQRVRNL